MQVTLYRDHPAEGWPSMDRYADSLREALRRVAPPEWVIEMPMPPYPWPSTYGRLLSRLLRYPLWARHQQSALNHIVDHSYGHLLFALDPARTVVTVHDVAPLRFPGRRLGLSGLVWKLTWRGIRRAQHIIADSAFMGAELQTHLDLPPQRFHVVPLAVSPHFRPQPADRCAALRKRYLPGEGWLLLHVGHTQPRKNLPTLLRALHLLRQGDAQIVLIQIGGQADASQRKLIQQLRLEHLVHFASYVSDQDLVSFYNAADVFAFPSLYEGFGLPVLEAMACGTPVVASNAASLPEVVGDAGLLADPHSSEALAKTIASVLEDSELAAELSRRGLERARQFTWERTARGTLAVYHSLIEGEI